MGNRPFMLWLLTVLCVATAGVALAQTAVRTTDQASFIEAHDRLTSTMALDKVACQGIEADWNTVSGMATPLSYRVPVQPPHHPRLVFVHPDLSVAYGFTVDTLGDALCLGVAVGAPLETPKYLEVVQSLYKDYLPIVTSEWTSGDIRLSATVFGFLPRDATVETGEEDTYVVLRYTLQNRGSERQAFPFRLLLGKAGKEIVTTYEPIELPVTRWQAPLLNATWKDSVLLIQGRPMLRYTARPALEASFEPLLADEHAGVIHNTVTFAVTLAPHASQSIDVAIVDHSNADSARDVHDLAAIDFDRALTSTSALWDSLLAPAMVFNTPDRRLNAVYKAHILSSLGMLIEEPGLPWQRPIQTPVSPYVWAWEFAHTAEPLIKLGYQKTLEPSLEYFVQRQNGIGPHSPNIGPSGQTSAITGSYAGTINYWSNETGSVLWALATKYLYSKDARWLERAKPSMLAAFSYLQSARERTCSYEENGGKVRHWGLQPAGVPGDMPPGLKDNEQRFYQFTFNDSFSWLGMSMTANAFVLAGDPCTPQLLQYAREYRDAILQAIGREEFLDPATQLHVVPNMVYYRDGGPVDPFWFADGPVQLYDTGLLKPLDWRFASMVGYTQKKYGILLGLAEHTAGLEMGGDRPTEWYPNQTERAYYRAYLGRGELEKSLLVFYSNLVYGMSQDTFQTVERFKWDEPNYSPLQPNASGNGRRLDMMRRMLIDEQDAEEGILWLLRGCPHRWYANGALIEAVNAPTLFGEISFRCRSQGDRVKVRIDSSGQGRPLEYRVVVRHAARKPIARAVVNGRAAAFDGETVFIRAPGEKKTVLQCYF